MLFSGDIGRGEGEDSKDLIEHIHDHRGSGGNLGVDSGPPRQAFIPFDPRDAEEFASP